MINSIKVAVKIHLKNVFSGKAFHRNDEETIGYDNHPAYVIRQSTLLSLRETSIWLFLESEII